jgi:hypothetical protein
VTQIHLSDEHDYDPHVRRHEYEYESLHLHYDHADEYAGVHEYGNVHDHEDEYELFHRDDVHGYVCEHAGEYDHVYVRARPSLLTPFF